MNCCKIKKVLIILFILLGNSIFIPQNLFSDSFRVKKVVFLDMEKDNTKNSDEDNSIQQEQVKVGINDAICIKLPKDLTFIQGIELNIKIPSLLARFPNTVIYSTSLFILGIGIVVGMFGSLSAVKKYLKV